MPRIDDVTADGRRVTSERGTSLPAGTSTLRIEYGTVSLSSASKLRFRYMLEGIDDEWVYSGDVQNATYTNVPSGNYRFRVSTTHDGRWTEPALWDFSVAPPLYRTTPFLTLVASGMVLLIATTWWLRLRAVRNQYALVFAERARVSREIHDTLLQSLAAIGVELETIATQLDPSQVPREPGYGDSVVRLAIASAKRASPFSSCATTRRSPGRSSTRCVSWPTKRRGTVRKRRSRRPAERETVQPRWTCSC